MQQSFFRPRSLFIHFLLLYLCCSKDGLCDNWTFTLQRHNYATKGSCVDIHCTFTHPRGAKNFNLLWYSGAEWYQFSENNTAKIFSNKTPSDVVDEYKGRTFLTGRSENDCSLQILNVQRSQRYFPAININNELIKSKSSAVVYIKENASRPFIIGPGYIEDKMTDNISCFVHHSCLSDPPTITWNISGHPIMENHEEEWSYLGGWWMESIMTYTASYTDDKTVLECAVTFPNYQRSVKVITLNIEYSPRNITISVIGEQEGENVTLLCSSQANPPVYNYTWYKIERGRKNLQGFGDTISVKNTTIGKYICAATNELGTKEFPVFDDELSENRSVILYSGIGMVVGLVIIFVLIIIFCIFRRKKISQRPSAPQEPPDNTYTVLKKREKEDEYGTLEPGLSGGPITQGKDSSKDTNYENLHFKT